METSIRTSSPVVFIWAVHDATAAAMWLWSSRPSWLWGASWEGDAGGVSQSGCQILGVGGPCIAFLGVSGLGRLGGRFVGGSGRGFLGLQDFPHIHVGHRIGVDLGYRYSLLGSSTWLALAIFIGVRDILVI